MTTTEKQFRSLNGYHQRKHRNAQPANVPPNGNLPPAAALADLGAPADLVAQVQTFHDLKDVERDQGRKAAHAHAAAEAATTDYRRKVRDALAAGEDPSKVRDTTEKHLAVAKAHAQFSTDARTERERLGHNLGPQLEAIAPTLFEAAEAKIETASVVLEEALAGIRATWDNYSATFNLRRWLSEVALNGGQVSAYHGATQPPPPVVAAMDALDHELGAVARLRSDEEQVAEYRSVNGGAA